MKNIVFNNQLNKASVLGGGYPKLSKSEEKELLATFFEQLLLFDHVVISTGRENYTLFFLIKNLGIETVERLFRAGYIKLSIKSTVIFAGSGRMNKDGTLDSSTVIGQPPIVGASLVDDDLDVEKNIHHGILSFRFPKKKQRELNKIIAPNYLSTDSMDLGVSVTDLVVNSYKSNLLENLGLPFEKDPEQLSVEERTQLLQLASSVLEMGIISKNSFKSYNNYENFAIAKSTYGNIGKAFNISENTSEILRIENTPDLKEIYINNNFDISDIFKIRHLGSAKYFRKWINEVGENQNSKEVTEAYLAEIKSQKSFFNTTKGKIIKNTFLFGATTGLGTLIGGAIGIGVGVASAPILNLGVDYGLGLIEEFTAESIFAGKNPKLFVDNLKKEIKKNDT